MSGMSGEKVMAPLSMSQIHTIHAHYKGHFRTELRNPTADSNHILNFSLKLDNFMMMQEMINFIFSGGTLFGCKHAFGAGIDRFTTNYLGTKRGEMASFALYFFGFFFLIHKLNSIERNDINYLINPREMSGEIFLNTCLHLYPVKVNLESYRTIMLEKQQLSMLRMSHINQAMGSQPLKVL